MKYKTRKCEYCQKKMQIGPRQGKRKYCNWGCKDAAYRNGAERVTIGEDFPCEKCGKIVKRRSAGHKHCPDCSLSQKYKMRKIGKTSTYQRTCVTCGKATNNYRCAACWEDMRKGHDFYGATETYGSPHLRIGR